MPKLYTEMNIDELNAERDKLSKELDEKVTLDNLDTPEIIQLKADLKSINDTISKLWNYKYSNTQHISLKDSAQILKTTDEDIEKELKENNRIKVISTRSGVGNTPNINFRGESYYPDLPVSFIESAADSHNNIKTFLGHISKDEKENRERDVRKWTGTLTEPTIFRNGTEDVAIVNWLNIHDNWLKERMLNKSFRDNIGLSHDMDVNSYPNKRNNKKVMTAVSLLKLYSVDLVTDPNYSCGVFRQSESLEKRGDDIMELETITIEDLKNKRPDLVKVVMQETQALRPNLTIDIIKTDYPALYTELTEVNVKSTTEQITALSNEVKTLRIDNELSKSDLPDFAKARVRDVVAAGTYKDTAEMSTKINEAIATEKSYIDTARQSGKIKTHNGGNGDGQENEMQVKLNQTLGIKSDKKE